MKSSYAATDDVGRLPTRAFVEGHARFEHFANAQGDVALGREDVDALTVMLFGPDEVSRRCVDELDVDAHAARASSRTVR